MLKSDRVDLVITGLEFPGNVSGLELCWNLRSHERSKMAHVLVLTSRDDTDTYIEALDSGRTISSSSLCAAKSFGPSCARPVGCCACRTI
ncbi:response regulator [Hankyongella ginsenosidimutans]|uniref:Response regulator n=1 Tax=Hankyongella ginsenosidimutans TaxID=1763828 RepID=A0A4D7CAK8_9SPHN|nr:response regulator [Hankyongella ginsenosidimutans]